MVIRGFFGHLLAFLIYNQQPICIILGEMTDADKDNASTTFWNRSDRHIRIRINPKIRARIPDHFCFKFWRWRRIALSECYCCNCCVSRFSMLLLIRALQHLLQGRNVSGLHQNVLPSMVAVSRVTFVFVVCSGQIINCPNFAYRSPKTECECGIIS